MDIELSNYEQIYSVLDLPASMPLQTFGAKQARLSLRALVWIVTVSSALVTLLGSGLNNLGHKYRRALPLEDCGKEVLNINVPNSTLCCEKAYHDADWVCIAAYDRINKLLSSYYAFIVPGIPLVATIFTEVTIQRGLNRSTLTAALLRSIIYFCIFIFRTVSEYFLKC